MPTPGAPVILACMASTPTPPTCPACGWFVRAPVAPGAACGRCGLPQDGVVAAELHGLAVALAAVSAERDRLLARRAHLLSGLPPLAAPDPFRVPAGDRVPAGGRFPAGGPFPVGGAPATPPGRATEATPLDVQNLLLWLGGVLLTVAAVAFTVISWGHLGIGGRAAVLAVLTLTAMAVPVPLLRRGLGATAEVIACLGLVLLLLDAYAVRRVLLPGPAGLVYAAWATALIAAVWALYAAVMRPRGERPGLRTPAHAALVLAQLPLPLWAFAEHSRFAQAAAFLAVAVLDGVATLPGRFGVPRVLLPTAAVLGAATGVIGLLTAGKLAVVADGPGAAVGAGALLLGAAACAMVIAHRIPAVPGPDPAAGHQEIPCSDPAAGHRGTRPGRSRSAWSPGSPRPPLSAAWSGC